MKLALLNTLSDGRGGGLNPDGLSLDLQFAADKTLTARRGPTPVFTRSSGDNGGTTYFGPLVDFDLLSEIPSIGITNGRASWFKSDGGIDITISYTGTRWRAVVVDNGNTDEYLAATGGEWRPDQADWSGVEFSVITSSTFGIVKAANNEPRFDHNPTSPFDCRGLLIEESRTNLTVRSDDFGAGEWNQAAQRNLTVTANNTASPSGATDADLLTVGATTTTYQVVQALPATGNITSGTAYTVSCFFKAKEVTRVNIYAGNLVTFPADAIFDLTGVGSIIGTPTGTASIQQYPNGWYRCIITATAGATSNTSFRISPVSGTSRTYAGNSVDSFWAWGAQLEAGSFPTSYIPTTTGSVVRSADVCSITGVNFTSFYNQSEGTIYTESRPATVNGTTTVFGVSNGTANERWLNRFAQNEQLVVTSSGIESALDALNPVAGTLYKVASAAKLNDVAMSINGLSVLTDTSQPMPTVDRATIGSVSSTVASIRYYKKRLTNAKLQALTV